MKKLKLCWSILMGKKPVNIRILSERLCKMAERIKGKVQYCSVTCCYTMHHDRSVVQEYKLYLSEPSPSIFEGKDLEELFKRAEKYLKDEGVEIKEEVII